MDIKTISPLDVFKMKCQEQDFDLQENDEVMDAFNEVLQMVKGLTMMCKKAKGIDREKTKRKKGQEKTDRKKN